MKLLAILLLFAALLSGFSDPERRLRRDYDALSARANATLATVHDLEERLRADGQTLHSDIIEARGLVESAMDEAGEALRDRDWTELKERLARARACLDKLRRKL